MCAFSATGKFMRVTSVDILEGPIEKTLLRMTGPMVIGIFAMMMFGAVDTFFISLMGTTELAAISFTFPVTFTIMNLSIGMGIATSVILAQVIGRKQPERAQRVCTDSLWFTLVLVIVVASLGLATIDPLFRALGATDATMPFIREYMLIWYGAVGLLVIPMNGNAAIRATGDTKWPSLLMMASGLFNAILDPLLIFGIGPFPELGVQGAALATAISWMIGFVAALWLLGVREKLLTPVMPTLQEWRETAGKMLRIGTPISIANMLTPITIMLLTALVARHGEAAVAGYGAGGRIEAFAMIMTFALTSTLSPFMAQNLGAGQLDRARQALKSGLKFTLFFQLLAYALLAAAAMPLSHIFSDDPQVLSVTRLYLWIMPLGATFYGMVTIYNTVFNAAHQSNKTLLNSGARLFVFILPMAALGSWLGDLPGLFIGSVIGNLLAALLARFMAGRMIRQLEKDDAQPAQRASI